VGNKHIIISEFWLNDASYAYSFYCEVKLSVATCRFIQINEYVSE